MALCLITLSYLRAVLRFIYPGSVLGPKKKRMFHKLITVQGRKNGNFIYNSDSIVCGNDRLISNILEF